MKATYFTPKRVTLVALTTIIYFAMTYFWQERSLMAAVIDTVFFVTFLELIQFFTLRERFETYCKKTRIDEIHERIESLGYKKTQVKAGRVTFQKDNNNKWWLLKGKDTIRTTETPFYIKVETKESQKPYFEEFTQNR